MDIWWTDKEGKKDGFTRNGQLIDERLVCFFCLGVFCCGFYLVDILFVFLSAKSESMTGLYSLTPAYLFI